MEIDIDSCFRFIQTQAEEHAQAKGNIVMLEAGLKSIKGALMEASDASSIAMKEADAYKDMRYLECANELARATTTEARLNTLIKAAFSKAECWRAEQYTKRAELRNLDAHPG